MTPILSSTLLRTQSDARLVSLASRGYDRAFEAIVERYRRPLHRWCRRVLPEGRAEDAVQQTFLKAWSALRGGAEVEELRPWLYTIARNAALDGARKAGYDYEELSDSLRLSPAPEEDLERRTVIRETLTGVAGLPENQREALLRTAAGHSRAEIARELDITEGAVRQLVHRARATVRAAATAITPGPLVSWAAALGAEGGSAGERIAELAAGAGSAGMAAVAIKTGTVVVAAGVLAAGPGADLRREVAKDSGASASARPHSPGTSSSEDPAAPASGEGEEKAGRRAFEERGGRRAGDGRDERRHARERRDGDDDDRSGSSGSRRRGSDDDDSDSSGSHHRGSDDDHDDSGSSPGGSSGGGEDDDSGSGGERSGTTGGEDSRSGDDSSGSGSSGSGSGSSAGDDDPDEPEDD